MATKAEQFKSDAQRAAHAKSGAEGARKGAGKSARARPRKNASPNPTSHNEAPRVGKQGAYELEPSTTSRPPRKSTRRSPAHLKTDSSLRIRSMNRTASPQQRAGSRGGNLT
jgi:hypothetical protein